MSEPLVKASQSMKQLDFHGLPSIFTLCARAISTIHEERM